MKKQKTAEREGQASSPVLLLKFWRWTADRKVQV